jgi:ribosomal protein S18 acetylase RimI-like enzyme
MTSAQAEVLTVRRLTEADAASYWALRLRGLREHPEAFTSSFEEESAKPAAQAAQRLAADGPNRFWGAFAEDALVGTVGLDRDQRRKNHHKALVVGMYVAPETTGMGVGRALMQALIDDARNSGIELLVLTVTDGNHNAVRLYERLGFASFGVEPGAIKVGKDYFDKRHMYLQLRPL